MTVGGLRPARGSFLFDNHPLQVGTSPDGRLLYLLPMSENALYVGDLSRERGGMLDLRRVAPVLQGAPETGTDCRALDVDRRGRVWAMVRRTIPGYGMLHHLCLFDPAKAAWRDLGVPYITNTGYVRLTDDAGRTRPWHHGIWLTPGGRLTAFHHHMAIEAARDGTIWTTVIAPFTLLRISPEAMREIA